MRAFFAAGMKAVTLALIVRAEARAPGASLSLLFGGQSLSQLPWGCRVKAVHGYLCCSCATLGCTGLRGFENGPHAPVVCGLCQVRGPF